MGHTRIGRAKDRGRGIGSGKPTTKYLGYQIAQQPNQQTSQQLQQLAQQAAAGAQSQLSSSKCLIN